MKKLLVILPFIILLSGCSIGEYNGKTAEEWSNEADDWESDYNICTEKLNEYEAALEEANGNIEEVNQNILEAQSYAGSNYEDMEYSLYRLQTVDTVDAPY